MRQPRLKAPHHYPISFYHCISRVVDRNYIFGETEKSEFLRLARECAAFCQVQVLDFCIMSNHFHLLLAVPQKPKSLPTMDEVLVMLEQRTCQQNLKGLKRELENYRTSNDLNGENQMAARFHARMWNLSVFMKELKQRFSSWYNRRLQRKGTLWEERFKSVVIDGHGLPLAATASYIDLNPVRSSQVSDPKDYKWNGYGSALAGDHLSLKGIETIVHALIGQPLQGIQALETYRVYLYHQGHEGREEIGSDGRPLRGSLSTAEVKAVIKAKGRLSITEYTRHKVRYFSDGRALGASNFVNEVFCANRPNFGSKRKTGPRRMKGLKPQLYVLRDLQKRVFG